jgi:hypothetical protein
MSATFKNAADPPLRAPKIKSPDGGEAIRDGGDEDSNR